MHQLDDWPIQPSATTVLLIEDEALIRFATADLLRIEGFAVLEAATADEALDLLLAGKSVDVILSDVQMPGRISGVGLARVVAERFSHIPVVLTSANQPLEELDLPFLPKPYRDDHVVAVLRAALNDRSGMDDENG